ncbi:hypothetical protein HK414_16010 [Ramlibacter terrae]|uniref:Uncharacterized protein n=1 Tax=Ramlibacter terrae TaxID=2732511 RepID=A0ABX6P571_9BURK|nr:hypothetical protein HK414_16010 [Ramlibacter terrae]
MAAGTVQVPEISYETTQITEQVGTELVQVGSQFTQLKVKLTQIGYYRADAYNDPNDATKDQRFREYFIEGIDYKNEEIPTVTIDGVVYWANAGDEANPTRRALAVTGDDASAEYRSFGQLNAAQKQAVLNHLQYKAAYQFSYDENEAWLFKTLNGVTTKTKWTPEWKDAQQQYYHVDVAGWRDKYVRMQSGARAAVLRVVSEGLGEYLSGDTTRDGQSNGTG